MSEHTADKDAPDHDSRCRLPLPHTPADCLAWAAARVADNRAEALARRVIPPVVGQP